MFEDSMARWRLVGWGFLGLILLSLFITPKINEERNGLIKSEIIKPSEEEKISKEDIFKVYFIAGILHKNGNSKIIKENIEKELSSGGKENIKVDVFDDVFYMHAEYQKESEIITAIRAKLHEDYSGAIKEDKKILVFSHSWGGILAKTAIAEFLAKVKDNLSSEEYAKLQGNIVLVTLATPHTLTYGSANLAKINLEVPVNVPEIKIFTFGGIFDVVVPVRFTSIEENKKIAPNTFFKKVRATHMMFLNSPRIQHEIFSSIFK
jgi:hypothetical protein